MGLLPRIVTGHHGSTAKAPASRRPCQPLTLVALPETPAGRAAPSAFALKFNQALHQSFCLARSQILAAGTRRDASGLPRV
jgi:hypothetical protein